MNLGDWGFMLLLWPGATLKAGQGETLKFLRDCVEGGLGEGNRSRPKGSSLFLLSLVSLYCDLFLFLLRGNWGFSFPVSYWIWGSVECESSESVLRGLLFDSVISIHGFWRHSLKLSFSAGHTISKARVWTPSSSRGWLLHAQPAPLKGLLGLKGH